LDFETSKALSYLPALMGNSQRKNPYGYADLAKNQ
jgi:hypothetical protein